MANIVKQPNGKYCIYSSGNISAFNLKEEDIINIAVDAATVRAKYDIENAAFYGEMIANIIRWGNGISNEVLKEMGFELSFGELSKYVPQKPLDQEYVSCAFTTFGKCPACGKRLQNCMGNKEEKCECGQYLDWKDR